MLVLSLPEGREMADEATYNGAAIRRLREDRRWTQKQLAERIGWDDSRISKIENNALPLTLSAIGRLAKAFGMHPAHVIYLCVEQEFPTIKTTKEGKSVRSLI